MKTVVLIAAALTIAFAALAATNTDVRTGVWTAEVKQSGIVQMNLFAGRDTETRARFGPNMMGFQIAPAKLTGFSSADGDTKFTLRAPAGTIDFTGHFSDGEAAGHFRFTPSDEFLRDMANLGYTEFRKDSLLLYATQELSPATIRELRTMGYNPSQRELDDIAVFRITPEVVREFGRMGYPNLSFRELVNMRVGNVDAAYIGALRELGYANVSAHEISESAILGVTPEYIREMNGVGLRPLSLRELRDLKVGNITVKKIDAYKRLGYDKLSPHQLSEMGIMGVTPEFIEQMNALGVRDVRKMIELKSTGAADILLKKQKQ